MLFSVIVATYNRADLLPQAVDSALAQPGRDHELIVVDDGSSDGTPDVLRGYGDRIRAMRQANTGQATARHNAVQVARGEYIVFLDSDDLWLPWTLSTYREVIDACARPSVMIAVPGKFADDGRIGEMTRGPLRYSAFKDVYDGFAGRMWYMGANAMVIRREAYDASGGFSRVRTNSEDVDLLLKLGTAEGFAVIESPHCVAYRQHEDAATRNLASTYHGQCHLIRQLAAGNYPVREEGGRSGARHLIGRITRSTSVFFLQQRRFRLAIGIYARMLRYHLADGRFRYLAAFPALLAWYVVFARSDSTRQAN